MTWEEFKRSIEEQGVLDDTYILWIDWQSWEPIVKWNKDKEVYVV
jgi:hypothetical protein